MGTWAEPITLLVMIVCFGVFAIRGRWPVGLSLAAAAWIGAAVNGEVFPVRHLVEGAFAYLDPILVIATATVFMRILADGGALPAMGCAVERHLGRRPVLLLPVLMLMVMFPGMITGSSTASVLTTGAMAAAILAGMGLAAESAAAFIAMGSILGMVAPPVNIPAMLIGGGIDLPYVGFVRPLALLAGPLAIGCAYGLGWPLMRRRGRPVAGSGTGQLPLHAPALSRPPLLVAVSPVAVAIGLMVAPQVWPGRVPDLGLPLIFVLAAATAFAATPRCPIMSCLNRATDEAVPVLAILAGVGAFIQVMTVTGARGWLVAVMLGAPSWALVLAAVVSIPLFGAISAFGSASVLGVPFLLAMLGRDEVVTTSALSLLASLGDLMLPAAIVATLAARVAGVHDRRRVLARCAWPACAVMVVGAAALLFSPQIGRWLR
jgi:gluconate:H+ symporter, GntP family